MKFMTIGYGNSKPEDFYKALKNANIAKLVDVRSKPYSRYQPSFNRRTMEAQLGEGYIYLGDKIGGLGTDPASETFQIGLGELGTIVQQYPGRVCIMCSESDPNKCHRWYWIGKMMIERGYEVENLMVTKAEVVPEQLNLFTKQPEEIAADLMNS